MVGTNCVFQKWGSGVAWILLPVVGWGSLSLLLSCPSTLNFELSIFVMEHL